MIILIWLDSSRATGDDTRSLCTTVCKWTYLGHAHMQQVNEKDSRDMEACGWDDDFWEEIGLGDLVDGHHAKIGMLFGYLFISISLISVGDGSS
jgi:ribulose kinase